MLSMTKPVKPLLLTERTETMKEKFIKWIKAAGIRAVKTVAETAIATIGTSVAFSQIDWKMVLSASLLSGMLSILISLKGLPELEN